jgi:hypothetical protein
MIEKLVKDLQVGDVITHHLGNQVELTVTDIRPAGPSALRVSFRQAPNPFYPNGLDGMSIEYLECRIFGKPRTVIVRG